MGEGGRDMIRLYLALTVALLPMVACGSHTPNGSASTPVGPVASVRSDSSSFAVITLDFQTLQLKNAYVTYHQACDAHHQPVSDDELQSKAIRFFAATDEYGSGPFMVSHVADFAVLERPPVDFGGVAVFDPCSGLVLFAGNIVWAGRGGQVYPADPIPADRLQRTSNQAPPPSTIGVAGTQFPADQKDALAAWDSVRDLNLVNDLAVPPYSVAVYLYPRTVGDFDPAAADWVILIHHDPTG